MRFIQCNCMTKTPVPKYHKDNCPVWLADKVQRAIDLSKKFVSRIESGKARSTEIYTDCKAFLESLEQKQEIT